MRLLLGILLLNLVWCSYRPQERQILWGWFLRIWPRVRPILGWFLIFIGILGVILPILQGIIFLVIGSALIGPRHRLIRRTRVVYKQFLYRLAGSSNRFLAWLGRFGISSLRTMNQQIRRFIEYRTRYQRKHRPIRLAIVPPPDVVALLDHYRQRYDPSYRHGLPPHIVLVPSSHPSDRDIFEQQVATALSQWSGFDLTLEHLQIAPNQHRLVLLPSQGKSLVEQLQASLPQTRPIQRQPWPALTIGKLLQYSSLASAQTWVAETWQPQRWHVAELVLYEERFGRMWHEVRRFRLCASTNHAECVKIHALNDYA